MERRRGKSTTSFPSSRTHGVGRQLKCKRRRESPERSCLWMKNTRRERDVLRSPPENFGTSHWISGGLLVFKSSNSLSLQKKTQTNNKTEQSSNCHQELRAVPRRRRESRAAAGPRLCSERNAAAKAGGCGGCFCIFDEKKKKRDNDHLHAFGNVLHVCSYELFYHLGQISELAERDVAA